MSKPAKTLAVCVGCKDDFYNGKNSIGVKRCWHFDSGKLEKRLRIGTWQRPPYNKKATVWVMTCRHEDGTCLVKPEALDDKGYWKG